MTDVAGIHYGQYRRDRYRRRDLPALWYDFLNYHRLTDALRTGGPNVLSARTSGAMQRDGSGNLVWAPHQLLENSNLSDRTADIPSGWADGGNAAGNVAYTDLGDGSFRLTTTATANRPYLINTINLVAGAIYTAIVYVHSLSVTSGNENFIYAQGTSGIDGDISYSEFVALGGGEGWYAVSFQMGAADTSITFRLGFGVGGAATGVSVLSKPMIVRGFYGTTALATPVKLSAEPFSDADGWIGTDDGDEPLYLARFDHDADGNPLGLGPGEGARTNSFLQSENLSASWTLDDITVSANAATAPDGNGAADQWTMDESPTGGQGVSQVVTVSAGTTVVVSTFQKYVAGNGFLQIEAFGNADSDTAQAWFDLQNGDAESTADGSIYSVLDHDMEDYGDGWYRCWVAFDLGAGVDTSIQFIFRLTTTGSAGAFNANASAYAWGFQCEEDVTFPSSYIPTFGASASRDDEEYYIDSVPAAITAASAITVYVKFRLPDVNPAGVAYHLMQLDDGSNSNKVEIFIRSNLRPRFTTRFASTNVADVVCTGDALDLGAVHKICLRLSNADYYLTCSNGDTASAMTAGDLTLSAITQWGLLNELISLQRSFWGHLQEVKIWTRAFTNAECDEQVGI